MKQLNYLNILKNKWQVIALVTAILVLLTVALSLTQTFKYRARTGLLVVQKQSASLDAYAAARASERLSANLAAVIKTDSFFQKVLNSNFDINNDWSKQDDKRRKQWQQMVSANVSPETGILTIDVYHESKVQAKTISSAIAYTLIGQAAEYHGAGDSVIIKVVDTPLVSNYPVKPNLLVNVLAAFALGLILSSGWVVYQAQKKVFEVEAEINEDLINTPQAFDREFVSQGIVKTMLSEPYGEKYYSENN